MVPCHTQAMTNTIIAVLNHKGGVGKTTLAWGLAACASAQGEPVTVIGADGQGDISRRFQTGQPWPEHVRCIESSERSLQGHLDATQGLRIVDLNPTDTGQMERLLERPGVVALVPVGPSVDEVSALNRVRNAATAAGTPLMAVPCRVHRNRLASEDLARVLDQHGIRKPPGLGVLEEEWVRSLPGGFPPAAFVAKFQPVWDALVAWSREPQLVAS